LPQPSARNQRDLRARGLADLHVVQALTGLIGARDYRHETRQRKLSDHADGTPPLF
jgi:hypothetical protein